VSACSQASALCPLGASVLVQCKSALGIQIIIRSAIGSWPRALATKRHAKSYRRSNDETRPAKPSDSRLAATSTKRLVWSCERGVVEGQHTHNALKHKRNKQHAINKQLMALLSRSPGLCVSTRLKLFTSIKAKLRPIVGNQTGLVHVHVSELVSANPLIEFTARRTTRLSLDCDDC
jgi:hypothetical protein